MSQTPAVWFTRPARPLRRTAAAPRRSLSGAVRRPTTRLLIQPVTTPANPLPVTPASAVVVPDALPSSPTLPPVRLPTAPLSDGTADAALPVLTALPAGDNAAEDEEGTTVPSLPVAAVRATDNGSHDIPPRPPSPASETSTSTPSMDSSLADALSRFEERAAADFDPAVEEILLAVGSRLASLQDESGATDDVDGLFRLLSDCSEVIVRSFSFYSQLHDALTSLQFTINSFQRAEGVWWSDGAYAVLQTMHEHAARLPIGLQPQAWREWRDVVAPGATPGSVSDGPHVPPSL